MSENLEMLRNRLPEFARDIKLNLQTVLQRVSAHPGEIASLAATAQ